MAAHYNPQEHEFRAESFGYLPLQRTGLEWDYQPVDEFIYQEYSDREVRTSDPLTVSRHQVLVINACSPDEIEEKQESGQDEDSAMSWKQLRPSALCTVLKSMYTGASISLLTAAIIGLLYMSISYLCYKTAHNCEFYPHKIPVSVQWVRTLSTLISCAFPLHVELCEDVLSLSAISVTRSERKTCSGFHSCLLFRSTLSRGSTSFRNI